MMPSSDSVEFRWLRTGDETFAAMLSTIETAKSSIELESYIYSAGPVGERFRDALIRACQRGVRVQVFDRCIRLDHPARQFFGSRCEKPAAKCDGSTR